MLSAFLMAQLPIIHAVIPPVTVASQYEKVEINLDLTAAYSNPYDYEEVVVWADFVSPAGDSLRVEGFYLETYTGPDSQGLMTLSGQGAFRLRFAAPMAGTWTYRVHLRDTLGETSTTAHTLVVQPGSSPHNQGFVRLGSGNYLTLDDGTSFVPIGQNLGWPNGNPYLDYQRWLAGMTSEGANFFRIWNCNWGLGVEWAGPGYGGLAHYQQRNAAYLDWLFDYAATQGVYAMLCLQHHGQVSTTVNPQWSESPYHVANGGMCAHPWEFFTHPTARALTRNRLRYQVARYGYARSLAAWELFNEVDWTDQYEVHQAEVADWHEEMSAFLKAIDPYQHLVSTSFAQDRHDPDVWTLPSIDFTQTHFYAAIPNLERTLVRGIQDYLSEFDKPTLTGEFGIRTAGGSLSSEDPDGIHFHNSLWGSLFGGGLGTGMSWWWDSYLEPQNLYHHYGPLSALVAGLPLADHAYAPVPVRVGQAAGDLVLNPTQGWGGAVDPAISILADGSTLPTNPELGEYLYGAQWNTGYRNPPTFQVSYPVAGTFTVRTGANTGQSPRLIIRVDGIARLQQDARVNTAYRIPIMAGSHRITVDNQGTDWITIAAYTFEGLGSALDAYVLGAASGKALAGWVLNHAYNQVSVLASGVPAAVSGGELVIAGVAAGNYYAKWYDCLTGALRQSDPVSPVEDTLRLPIPAVTWDLALVVDEQWVSSPEAPSGSLSIEAYPNPWREGQLTVILPDGQPGPTSWALLDVSGRALADGGVARFSADKTTFQLTRPASLTPGIYWLRVAQPGRVGTLLLRMD
jgi:hypothetical protein